MQLKSLLRLNHHPPEIDMNTALQKIYSQVPRLQCKGHCHIYCTVIPTHPAEAENIIEKHGAVPLPTKDKLRCSYLGEDKRCQIYEDRPLICRLWGAVRKMKCEWGCSPIGGYLSEGKSSKLQKQCYRIPTKEPIDSGKILEDHLEKMIEEGEVPCE